MTIALSELMTSFRFISIAALLILAACSGQRKTVEQGTILTTTDTAGIRSATDIQVKSAEGADGEGQVTPDATTNESDELLPSNADGLDGSAGDGMQDRKAHRSGGASSKSLRKNITVGIAVGAKDVGSEQNGSTVFMPASITKLITSGIALEVLGPDFHFTHTFSFRKIDAGGSMVASFRWQDDGDPSLANRYFSQYGERHMPTLSDLAQKLHDSGLRAIKGKITLVSADPRLDLQESAPGVEAADRHSFFGAFPTAFTYAHNFPLRSAAAGRESVHAQFVKALKSAGISVDESASDVGTAAASIQIASPPLRKLIIPMNKASDNLIADTLFMAIARRNAGNGQSLNDAGHAFYTAILRKWMRSEGTPGLADQLTIYDGSGLSRADHVTPDAFLAVLKYYVKQSYFQDLFNSLPIAGQDGTLGHRMRGSSTRGIVHAKTGTVRGNYQLAGFIPRLNGDGKTARAFVPFVVLTKTPDGPAYRMAAHAYQDEIVSRLADQIN